MEREVGGGIRMGNTCKPMAVSFQCMTKSTTNKNNNNKEKIKVNQKEEMVVIDGAHGSEIMEGLKLLVGFPGGTSGKEIACQCKRCGFDL